MRYIVVMFAFATVFFDLFAGEIDAMLHKRARPDHTTKTVVKYRPHASVQKLTAQYGTKTVYKQGNTRLKGFRIKNRSTMVGKTRQSSRGVNNDVNNGVGF